VGPRVLDDGHTPRLAVGDAASTGCVLRERFRRVLRELVRAGMCAAAGGGRSRRAGPASTDETRKACEDLLWLKVVLAGVIGAAVGYGLHRASACAGGG
jgi:hypothetical protein